MQEPIQKPGVENPRLIDLITKDPQTGEVVLLMIEPRPWGTHAGHIVQLQNKFDSYVSYILDGFFLKQYPQYAKQDIRIQLDCIEKPSGQFQELIEAAIDFAERENLRFVVNVVGLEVVQDHQNKYQKALK